MDPMSLSPHINPNQPMMMSHPHHGGPPTHGHPGMMPQPQSPFAGPAQPDFGMPMHPGHPSFHAEMQASMGGHPSAMSRQMSHPGAPGMPPQHMMMSPPQGGPPYMGGPAPGSGPYMMGGGM